MTSNSLKKWKNERSQALQEVKAAHSALGGSARGRRYATKQINHAYTVLLSSQFQGFCRDLHTECVDCLANSISPASLQTFFRLRFTDKRKLDHGNPNPGNIAEDYNFLGFTPLTKFWDEVKQVDSRNNDRIIFLNELNAWRNAISHQDFQSPLPADGNLRLATVSKWHTACSGLAKSFDIVMKNQLVVLLGSDPW